MQESSRVPGYCADSSIIHGLSPNVALILIADELEDEDSELELDDLLELELELLLDSDELDELLELDELELLLELDELDDRLELELLDDELLELDDEYDKLMTRKGLNLPLAY